MFKHLVLALAVVTFGFMGSTAARADDGCCCGKDAKCCQSTTSHKCCGGDEQKCGCCSHDGGHGDPDQHGGRHA